MTTERTGETGRNGARLLRTVGVDVASTCVDERNRVGTRDINQTSNLVILSGGATTCMVFMLQN